MKSVSEDALLEAEPSLGCDSIRTEKGSSGPLLADSVAKVILQKVPKILRAAGANFV